MDRFQNEKGYALLLVMLMVVLFTLMGMGLLEMNMNAAKQFNTKEEQVQARNQAEMGVLHYKAQLENIVKNKKPQVNLACVDLKKSVSGFSEDAKSGYVIKYEDIQCDLSAGVFTISVESTGNSHNREKAIKAKFNVNKLGSTNIEDGKIPESTDYNDGVELIDHDWKIPNGTYSPSESSLHVTGDLTFQPGKYKGDGNDALINRNLFVDKNIVTQTHTCLVVRGDLIVKGNITSVNKIYMFVYGDAYFNTYTYTSIHNEIFVSGRVFENGIEVRNKYKPVPSGTVYNYGSGEGNDKKSCSLPGSGNPGTAFTSWDLSDEIDVDYFID